MKLQLILSGLLLGLSACTTTVIDQYKEEKVTLSAEDAIVILGRRHANNYETEPDFIRCIGDEIQRYGKDIQVLEEQKFLDDFYPWFEPRIAPMHIDALETLLARPKVAERFEKYNVRYLIWIDGSTQTTDRAGSVSCVIGTGAGGCFGFGTWDKESNYEATVWDFKNQSVTGRVNADASGTSYIPAIVVPIPIIAQVQDGACEALGKQLHEFFEVEDSGAS